jgi:hypothetical protein
MVLCEKVAGGVDKFQDYLEVSREQFTHDCENM